MKYAACLGLVFWLFTSAVHSSAQSYPAKPIRLVVPYPAGGNADIVGRVIAQQVGDQLGQRVIVDNRGGAGGIIGTEAVARSAPDGYTLLLIALGHAVNPSLYPKLPFDSLNDFIFVIHAVSVPNILVVHPSFPARSVKELIAEARRSPGKINYGSGGNGTSNHLAGELFKSMAGVDIVRITYKSSPFAMVDLLAGQIDVMFDIIVTALPHVALGKLRALAVTGSRRSTVAPSVPTVAEAGVPGYEVNGWQGIVAPAGTPRDIVETLNSAIRHALQSADAKQALISNGADVVGGSPEEFTAYVRSEMAKWSKLVAQAGIRPN